jgi:hypothetical protein
MRTSLTAFDQIKSQSQFEANALKLFHYQYQHNSIYRSYCDLINVASSDVKKVTSIPFLPIQFFKSHTVSSQTDSATHIFTSSKTTGQIPSKHHVHQIDLYIKSFEKGFQFFYGNIEDYILLALLPSYKEQGNSSLIFMANHLIQKTKHPQSGFYLENWDTLTTTLQQLERQEEKKIILLGVTYALLNGAEKQKLNLKHTLIMETGGMKGMRKEWVRSALHEKLQEGYGVSKIHSEYGMTELLSQAYSKGEGRFYCPPWMQVLTRSAEDPFELIGTKKTGGLNIIDLANVDSCAFIATQDLGKTYDDGSFEVLGRFDAAEIRGCNLLVV